MKLHHQLLRFGGVGTAAMLLHLAVVATIVPLGGEPLLANAIAFLAAFQISCYGHRNWTFRSKSGKRASYLKLLTVSLGSFALNEGLYAILLQAEFFDYRITLLIVMAAVSLLTFAASRLWVFRPADFIS